MEKLNCKSLMIGDCVLHEGEPYQIRRLGIYGVDRDGEDYPAVCVGKPTGIGLIVEINEIEPIPITPEILEKNGFEKLEEKYYRRFLEEKGYYEAVRVYFDEEPHVEVRVLDGNEFKGRIKYVHQLQQAMRLCHIKGKEIEL